jgi:hypothetical protein
MIICQNIHLYFSLRYKIPYSEMYIPNGKHEKEEIVVA